MRRVHIGLGSNLGDRQSYLRRALEEISRVREVRSVRCSSFYETKAVGGPPQPDYLNAVAEIETSLSPFELLAELQRIEKDLGRIRGERWGPRTIDLDILLDGDTVLNTPELTIPHPRMHERQFVLMPLSEIAPDAMHPLLHKTAAEMRRQHERV